jgi:inorganic pyrophosphatase
MLNLMQRRRPAGLSARQRKPQYGEFAPNSRLLGVIEAEQSEDGKTERNDRLVAVAAKSQTHAEIKSLSDLSPTLLKEIEHFFIFYNQERGKKFRPLARRGPKRAERLVREQKRKGRK